MVYFTSILFVRVRDIFVEAFVSIVIRRVEGWVWFDVFAFDFDLSRVWRGVFLFSVGRKERWKCFF